MSLLNEETGDQKKEEEEEEVEGVYDFVMSSYLTYNEADIIHYNCLVCWAKRLINTKRDINKLFFFFSSPKYSLNDRLNHCLQHGAIYKRITLIRLQFDQVVHLYQERKKTSLFI